MMARRLLSSANHLFSSSIGGRTNGWNCARKEQPVSYSKVASSDNGDIEANAPKPGQWLTLPPFISRVNVGELGRELMGTPPAARSDMTALKWVKHCCPDIPHSLVQKLFRLRQIRMECVNPLDSLSQRKQEKHRVQLKRISAKEIMNPGTKIYLPVTVHEIKASKKDVSVQRRILESDADTIKYIRSLELYKDPAIIVLNKPPGLPVQGGPGIQTSMDVLAATALSYDYTDSPRLPFNFTPCESKIDNFTKGASRKDWRKGFALLNN